MPINKVIYGNDTLIDITDTNITPNDVLEGKTFYRADGTRTTGSLGLVTSTINGLMSAIDKVKLDGINIKYKTTAQWNEDLTYIPALGEIIIYLDHGTYDDNGTTIYVPDIKIGDGQAYCVDLPFICETEKEHILSQIEAHVNNSDIHVTTNEKNFWNNKLNYNISGEMLTFDRN